MIVTGGLAHALRTTLAAPGMQEAFCGTGKYARLLAAVPRTLGAMEHGVLVGAAEALARAADDHAG